MPSRLFPRPLVARAAFASLLAVAASLALSITTSPASAAKAAHPPAPLPIIGRWDVTVSGPGYEFPAWFELREEAAGLTMYFTGRFGAPAAVPYVEWDGSHLEFRFETAHRWRGTFNGRWFTGTTGGEDETWIAERAPRLEPVDVHWGKPEPLFDGRTLTGWRPRHAGSDHGWRASDGVLSNLFAGDDLVSLATFTNFKLSLQFRLQPHSDSGVHLRGRYEVQLSDKPDEAGAPGVTGAIFGQVAPSRTVSCTAGMWHTLEVTLVGREVTVVLDATTVIDRKTINGITGDALDSHEGKAGPIMLQGYLGKVEFRKLEIRRGS